MLEITNIVLTKGSLEHTLKFSPGCLCLADINSSDIKNPPINFLSQDRADPIKFHKHASF